MRRSNNTNQQLQFKFLNEPQAYNSIGIEHRSVQYVMNSRYLKSI